MVYTKIFNPFKTTKLFNLNFHPLEVLSRWRDPQLQVSENYSDLTKKEVNCFQILLIDVAFHLKQSKMKIRIYAAPAVKWLRVKTEHSGHCFFNPLSPHDALMHHFTSLKIQFISLKLRVLKGKFPWNWFTNTLQFSLIFHSHQFIFIHYKSRIATAIRGL